VVGQNLATGLARNLIRDPDGTSIPELQNCLKKMGKKPAITVVAKAEFAQSYIAQE
jgi:hypothetical protein